MLRPSSSRLAAHAEAAALVDAFIASGRTITGRPQVAPKTPKPALITCDGSTGWATRLLAPKTLANLLATYVQSTFKGLYNMITFHPAARKTAQGFIPMVTLRAAKGRMVGSKVSQTGNVFATAQEALEAAVVAATRVAASLSFTQVRA